MSLKASSIRGEDEDKCCCCKAHAHLHFIHDSQFISSGFYRVYGLFYALLSPEAWLASGESQGGKLCGSPTSLLGSGMTADESQLVGLTEAVNRIPRS